MDKQQCILCGSEGEGVKFYKRDKKCKQCRKVIIKTNRIKKMMEQKDEKSRIKSLNVILEDIIATLKDIQIKQENIELKLNEQVH